MVRLYTLKILFPPAIAGTLVRTKKHFI